MKELEFPQQANHNPNSIKQYSNTSNFTNPLQLQEETLSTTIKEIISQSHKQINVKAMAVWVGNWLSRLQTIKLIINLA